ncbi:mtDNA inheritance, partitioning of the mitochondrial organelle [Leucoagaricus gongylophorus]
MREILYFQLGNYSNYIGTHFWNTQEAYLSQQSGDEGPIDDQVSLAERQDPDGVAFYPRVLMFDWKENFGSLARSNAMTGMIDDAASNYGLWDQPVEEIRQNEVTKSPYHIQLEEKDQAGLQFTTPKEVRYWSDFSHVYYLPRSVHRVSRPMNGETGADNWKQSQDQFRQYNEDNDLMDSSVRVFLEESDSIQGIQLMTDVSAFGGFCNALRVQLEDELLKTPAINFPILYRAHVDANHVHRIHRLLNEALYLQSLREHANLSIPINLPQVWSEKAWAGSPMPDSPYFSSSIIAAHVETMTSSLRARTPQDSISINAYGSHLGIGGGLPAFAEISGVIPVNIDTNFGHSIANFTIPSSKQTDVGHNVYIVCLDTSTYIPYRDPSTLHMTLFVGSAP